MEELSVNTNVIEANAKGVILLDKKWVSRNARIIDTYDEDRPGENTIYRSPYADFQTSSIVVKDYGDQQRDLPPNYHS
jgi:hypothetical protein